MDSWIEIGASEWVRKALRASVVGDRGVKRRRSVRFCKASAPMRHGPGHYRLVGRTLDGVMLEHEESGKRCELTTSEFEIAKGRRSLGVWVEVPPGSRGDVKRIRAGLSKSGGGASRTRCYRRLDGGAFPALLGSGDGHWNAVGGDAGAVVLRHDRTGVEVSLERAALKVFAREA